MNKYILVVLGLVLFIVSGWILFSKTAEENEEIVANNETEQNEEKNSELDKELFESSWLWKELLIDVEYADDGKVTPKKSDAFVITFLPDGTFKASTDCNYIGGSYDLEIVSNSISFKDVFITEMYCEDSQDLFFVEILSSVDGFELKSGELVLSLKVGNGKVFFKAIELVN
jgi:heat shock protein HslJ